MTMTETGYFKEDIAFVPARGKDEKGYHELLVAAATAIGRLGSDLFVDDSKHELGRKHQAINFKVRNPDVNLPKLEEILSNRDLKCEKRTETIKGTDITFSGSEEMLISMRLLLSRTGCFIEGGVTGDFTAFVPEEKVDAILEFHNTYNNMLPSGSHATFG